MANIDFARLYRRLGVCFKNPALLKQALTHCSMGSENNERFEFLGDSILSFAIAHRLFALCPEFSEGELSRLRSYFVKGERLTEIALEIGLGDFLFLGQGELKSGGFRRASILADALEAVIAAVFLDSGMDAAVDCILRLYETRLQKDSLHHCMKDAKTLLQEYLQCNKKTLPAYTLLKTLGDEHDQMFYVGCSIQGIDKTFEGVASTRRKAEQLAATQWLDWFKSMQPSTKKIKK